MYMKIHFFITSHFVIIYSNDVIMDVMESQITSLTIVYSTVYSGTDQRKDQSFASLAFVRAIPRWPVVSPHKWRVTRKMFPFDEVIMQRIKPTFALIQTPTTSLFLMQQKGLLRPPTQRLMAKLVSRSAIVMEALVSLWLRPTAYPIQYAFGLWCICLFSYIIETCLWSQMCHCVCTSHITKKTSSLCIIDPWCT